VQGGGKLPGLAHAVPNIYAVAPAAPPVSLLGRLVAAALAGACLAVLVVAAGLTPSRDGFGTHRSALGMPACNFLATTGMPCPSCGMTTSFAWVTKGQVAASLYVQPMGTVLALLAAATVWGGLYVALTGRPAHRLLRLLPPRYTLFPLLLLGILAWGWKILIHLSGVDGWN
jgi:hypothetical protein